MTSRRAARKVKRVGTLKARFDSQIISTIPKRKRFRFGRPAEDNKAAARTDVQTLREIVHCRSANSPLLRVDVQSRRQPVARRNLMTVILRKKAMTFSTSDRETIVEAILFGHNIEDPESAECALMLAERLQEIVRKRGFVDSLATRREVLERLLNAAEQRRATPRASYRSLLRRR